MVDPSFQRELQTDWGGSWTLVDAPDLPPDKAQISENMEYLPGQARSRVGFAHAYNANEAISSLFNWISSLGNLLVWYRTSDNSVQLIDIENPSQSTVISGDLIGAAAVFSEAGARLYGAFFNTSGRGASGARIITFQNSAYVNDLAFLPPITYTPSPPSEPGAGDVTAGDHFVAYRIEYRSGFITRPSPDSGNGVPGPSTFQPVLFTASGGANLSWTLNTTWPVGAVNVYMLMTPVSNPAQFLLVPGAVQPVTGGTLQSITFNVDISDELLFSTGIDQTTSVFFLTNTVAGIPQFFPSSILTHGNRMVYVTTVSDSVGNKTGALYISNIGAYQEISPDLSLVQLPGLKDINAAISLDQVLYIFGPQWTYRTIDTGGFPSTWPTPGLVDKRRGTLAVRGALVSPSGTYGWVAARDGLYYFVGTYPQLPISYYQSADWQRINWNAPQAFDIVDNPDTKKVIVLAALDGSQTRTHLLTWDYTRGFDASDVQYSIDAVRNYNMGAIAMVKNGLSGMPVQSAQREELWIAPNDANWIIRNASLGDPAPYRDVDAPIAPIYKTRLFPQKGAPGQVYQHHGADFRVKGTGSLQVTALTLDDFDTETLLDIDLDSAPGQEIHRGVDLLSEGVCYQIAQGTNLVIDPEFENIIC